MRIYLAATLLLSTAIQSRAADLDPGPGQFDPAPAMEQMEFGTGWYLRGGIGHALDGTLTASIPVLGSATIKDRNNFNGDVAVGYQFNNWLRGDVSLDYSQSKGPLTPFSGPVLPPFLVPGSVSTGTDHRGVFANFFVDVGTWNRITPYIGVGYGLVRTALGSNLNAQAGTITLSQTHAAWSVMAGLAYNIDRHIKLELGYRFVNYGKGSSNYALLNFPLQTYSLRPDPNKEQQFRIGVRYVVD